MTGPIDNLLARLKLAKTTQKGGRCVEPPIGCGKPINKEDFREEKHLELYRKTDLCQSCQDDIFGTIEPKAPLPK